MTTIRDLTSYLETIAPPVYQESYDNAGLIVGTPQTVVTNVLCSLDATEAIVDEALAKNCNVIVAHHPIVFRGLKRFNGRNYVERTVMKAIKNDVAIYAIHTNLDNVLYKGVNGRIGERLGLKNSRILSPKSTLLRGEWRGNRETGRQLQTELAKFLGKAVVASAETMEQVQLNFHFSQHQQGNVLRLIQQYAPANAAGFHFFPIQNKNPNIGSGLIGELAEPLAAADFLAFLKKSLQVSCIKYTTPPDRPIRIVALCGGSGGFLLRTAIGQGADVFVTSDYKYHEFFDAEGQLMIADIGHYESEQFTIPLLAELISQKFSNFAAYCTEVSTNPVQYYV